MARAQNPNLEILMLAVEQLGDLADEMVFVGGCATGLLITDPAAPPIRVTRLVAVLDGRPSIVDEVKKSESKLTNEISQRFQALLQDQRFIDSVSGHMPTDETSQTRVKVILDIVKKIAKNK